MEIVRRRTIDYAPTNWAALCRYCDDSRLENDKDGSERSLRAVAFGRRNWIFFVNERVGPTATVFQLLI